jgi:hypothetical protein
MYGICVVTSFTKLDPNFQTVFIERQTPESLNAVARYLDGHFLDRSAIFASIDGGPAEISLMAAGHYYGTRFAYQHPQAEYTGLEPSNILHFSVIACLTYSLITKLHASPVLVSLFTTSVFYDMIRDALLSHDQFSLRFLDTVLTAMPMLYLFNTFTEQLRPIILRLFTSHQYCEKQMSLFLLHLSNSTTSPTSYLRRSMIRDEGYIQGATNEMTSTSKERIIAEEKAFWAELGDEGIEFVSGQPYEDDYPQKFHCGCIQKKGLLGDLVRAHPTADRVRFIVGYTHSHEKIEIQDSAPFLALLDEALAAGDTLSARAIIHFLVPTKLVNDLLPYFNRRIADPLVVLTLTTILKADELQQIRQHITVDFMDDLFSIWQKVVDPKTRHFINKVLSDDDTLLHSYLFLLERMLRTFCLTTQTIASLHWDEIRRTPQLFARAVHARFRSPAGFGAILLRRPHLLPVNPPSDFSIAVAERMLIGALEKKSVTALSWASLYLQSRPFLFLGIDCYFVFERLM